MPRKPRLEAISGAFAGKLKNFGEERKTGFEPATLSLGKEGPAPEPPVFTVFFRCAKIFGTTIGITNFDFISCITML